MTFLIVTGSGYLVWGTVKIGLNYPFTGPYKIMGNAYKTAAENAFKEINADGGILGNKVELVMRDSQSKWDMRH